MKDLKLSWGLLQFFHQNEPKLIAQIGNIAFILGLIAGIPATAATFGATLPLEVVAISAKAATLLIGLKGLSKTFGFKDANGNPVNITCPPVVDADVKK
jgi:hypothetical protein